MYTRFFNPFNLLFDKESKTAIFLNPKVMTTSIRETYAAGCSEFRNRLDLSEGRFRWLPKAERFPLFGPKQYLTLLNDPAIRRFTVVRHPADRAYSGWNDKFCQPHLRGGSYEDYPRSMRQGVLKDFRQFARRSGLPGAQNGTLLPFSVFLCRIENQRNDRRNQHWATQTSVTHFGRVKFDRVFRFENEIECFFQEVFGRMGFCPDWLNARSKIRMNHSEANLLACSKSETELIRRIYHDDFVNFGYTSFTVD